MPKETLEQKIKDLEAQGGEILMEVEAAGGGFAELTWAAMNLAQGIMWLKKGIE
jgi:hypothetical protein